MSLSYDEQRKLERANVTCFHSLSSRAQNVLQAAGITSLHQLQQTTDLELKSHRSCGKLTIKEIRDFQVHMAALANCKPESEPMSEEETILNIIGEQPNQGITIGIGTRGYESDTYESSRLWVADNGRPIGSIIVLVRVVTSPATTDAQQKAVRHIARDVASCAEALALLKKEKA